VSPEVNPDKPSSVGGSCRPPEAVGSLNIEMPPDYKQTLLKVISFPTKVPYLAISSHSYFSIISILI